MISNHKNLIKHHKNQGPTASRSQKFGACLYFQTLIKQKKQTKVLSQKNVLPQNRLRHAFSCPSFLPPPILPGLSVRQLMPPEPLPPPAVHTLCLPALAHVNENPSIKDAFWNTMMLAKVVPHDSGGALEQISFCALRFPRLYLTVPMPRSTGHKVAAFSCYDMLLRPPAVLEQKGAPLGGSWQQVPATIAAIFKTSLESCLKNWGRCKAGLVMSFRTAAAFCGALFP